MVKKPVKKPVKKADKPIAKKIIVDKPKKETLLKSIDTTGDNSQLNRDSTPIQ